MKILLFNDYSSNVGGAERFFDAMYKALQHAQLKVYTAALQEKANNKYPDALRNANHRILIHPKIVQIFEAHESQLANLDYKTAILGLNQYRGLMYSKKKIQYAEAFICMPSADYFNLMAAVSS